MTVAQLLDALKPEIGGVFSHRSYRNFQDIKVLLIDMHYPDDVDRAAHYIREHFEGLIVDVVTAQPMGGALRRRIVVSGFDGKGGSK